MNMYHSLKKFSKCIVPTLTYNDKKTYMLQQWTHGDIYTMTATYRSLSNICTVILSIHNIYKKQQ